MPDDAELTLSIAGRSRASHGERALCRAGVFFAFAAVVLGCGQLHPAESMGSAPAETIEVLEPPSASAISISPSPSSSNAPRVVKSTAAKTLGDDVIGCWQNKGASERWSFRRKPSGDIEVVREIDPQRPEYDRAKLPADVRVDDSLGVFGFESAGPIHALMFACSKTSPDAIHCGVFASHAPGEKFRDTGNTIDLARCL